MADTPTTDNLAPFDVLLGLEIVEAGPTKVVAQLQVQSKHTQPYGIVHGGVYCSMAETTASYAAVLALRETEEGAGAVGQSNHTDFLKATRGGTLTATATPVHIGRSVQLWNVNIRREDDTLVAQSKVRMFNVRPENVGG